MPRKMENLIRKAMKSRQALALRAMMSKARWSLFIYLFIVGTIS